MTGRALPARGRRTANAPTSGDPSVSNPTAMSTNTAQTDRPQTTRLPLGHVVATPGALDVARAHGLDVVGLLHRHRDGDWGAVSDHDAQANDHAVAHGARVLSAYETAGGRLWIITEADRSATTVLLPSEY